jgi:hypothetical protein
MSLNFRMLPPPGPVAGTLVTNAATTTSSPTISAASVPAWVAQGSAVFDVTTGHIVGAVLSTTGTTVTLAANAASAIASGDVLSFTPPQTATVNGRNYGCAPGLSIDVVDFDAIQLVAQGWIKVAVSGPTTSRPTTNPNATPPYLAAKDARYFDVTINQLIVFDGQAWRNPAGSPV